MKHLTKILTFVFCLAITSGASHAQTAAPQPVDGIIWLSPEEFGAQLDAGTLRLITPGVLAEQQRRSHETAERSRAIVEAMRSDEVAHGQRALAAGGAALPAPVRSLMHYASGVMTGTAYWL